MAGTNLTREEARERSANISTMAYTVALDLTGSETTFKAVTDIHFEATPGSSTFVDLIAHSVQRIFLNGHELNPAIYNDSRIPLKDLRGTNVLHVESTQYYSNTGEGLHRYTDPSDAEVYLYSQFEVADARRVFPNFEQPDLKAEFTFSVTAPDRWQVFSNSPTPEPEYVKDGIARWDFTPTERISTYLAAIVAGPYEGVEDEPYRSIDGREIPLGIYARKSLAPYLDADEIFEVTRQGFEYYEHNYAHPYPFRKYDQVFCPEYNAGAMENAGLVTIVESYVFRTKPTGAIIDRRVITILHELAHMWFGDLVTMEWWDDLWLNESFAEFMSHLAAVNNTRWREAWTTFLTSEKVGALHDDQLPTTHPVAADIRDIEDVLVNFDQITYGKGASALKQLVAYVGLEEFLAGVRAYIAKHKWSNATLRDLLVELEQSSGKDLGEWTKVWLQEAGVTTLRTEIDTDNNGKVTSFAVAQTPDAHASLRPHRMKIAGYSLHAGQLTQTSSQWVDISGARTQLDLFVGEQRPDFILLNSEDWTYAKLRFDKESLHAGLTHINAFTNHLDRTVFVFSVYDMLRDGDIDAHTYADFALNVLRDETDGTVLRYVLGSLHTALRYADPATSADFKVYLGDALFDIASHVKGGSDAQLQILTNAIRLSHTNAHIDTIRGWLEGINVPEGFTVDQEVRWNITVALASSGHYTQEDIDAEFARDSSSYGQIFAAQATGALPSPQAKEATWQEILNPTSNTRQRNLALGFMRSTPESMVIIAEKYFDEAARMWDNNSVEIASNMLNYAYPAQLAGRTDLNVDLLQLGKTWLETTVAAPACRRLVLEQIDGTQRALRNQAVDREARAQHI